MSDHVGIAEVSRWFTREYQFTTSAYQIFAGLARMHRPTPSQRHKYRSHYEVPPTVKYMLRQVKAMDYSIPASAERDATIASSIYRDQIRTNFASMQSGHFALSTKDEAANPIHAQELDIALLVLYGHILYSSGSYSNALAYFFRAYALLPNNAMILLSIALAYVHFALKRQSGNRHYLITQGFAFLHNYRKIRFASGCLVERQEAEFNTARLYHLLGLNSSAIDGYGACLATSKEIEQEAEEKRRRRREDEEMEEDEEGGESQTSEFFVEDFGREAAYALVQIYASGGQVAAAREIAEKYLVF